MGIDDLSALSILIPLILAGILFRHLNKTLKRLSVFIVFSALTELMTAIYFELGWNNYWISHVYAFVQIPLFAWIFSSFIAGFKKKLIFFSACTYILFSIVNLLFWEDLTEFNSNQRYFAAFVIVLYCSLYFIQVFSEAEVLQIERESNFWISSSILVYTAGTLFLFILISELMDHSGEDHWKLNCILNIILNLGLTTSLWLGKTKSN